MADLDEFRYGRGFDFDPVYGIKEDYGEAFLGFDYRFPAGQFGFPTDPTTANQLDAVTKKISTGAKVIEFSGLSITGGGGPMAHLDKIPKQHLEEVRRLKALTGIDLTFHGPLVEPTGVQKQGWQEEDRENAEKNMFAAVKRAHELDPKGNIVVTFHSSVSLPEPETYAFNDNGEKQVKEFWIVNEQGGNFQNIAADINYLRKEEKFDPDQLIKKQNEEGWFKQLQQVNFHAHQGAEIIDKTLSQYDRGPGKEEKERGEKTKKSLLRIYKEVIGGNQKAMEDLKDQPSTIEKINQITHGDIYLRDAYSEFQNIFNNAYKAAEKYGRKDDLNKLNRFRDEFAPKIKEMEADPSKVQILGDELIKGVNVLRAISPPQTIKKLRGWAVDKAAESFANTAFSAYKEFKGSAPIISIENPPAGSGLSTADDLKSLVNEARDKFVERAKKDLGMSESQAKEQAEKLIGVTWDVGHINMLRGKGYSEKQVIEQTAKIAPFVKHVHLSDNFGIEHTELPMGMGNVPTKPMLDLIHKYNDKVKKIVETGDWFSRQGGLAQTQTPVRQTLMAFGSPTHATNLPPYWNQLAGIAPGYFLGQGNINPEIHHSLYGAGFSNLPLELGGQMGGRSRASGAPIE